jgi:predicted transcriptional regulator
MNAALDYIKNNAESVEVIDEEIERDEKIEIDSLFIDVLKFLVDEGKASISAIQRKFCVGYNRAGQIIETMVDMGYVSSFDGARARKVLITKEDFETLYGEKSSLLEQVDLQEKSALSEPPVEKALFVEILRFVIINGSASISVIQ